MPSLEDEKTAGSTGRSSQGSETKAAAATVKAGEELGEAEEELKRLVDHETEQKRSAAAVSEQEPDTTERRGEEDDPTSPRRHEHDEL